MKKRNCLLSLILACVMCLGVAGVATASETLNYADYMKSDVFDELSEAYIEYSTKAFEQGKFVELSLEEFVCSYDFNKNGSVSSYLEQELDNVSRYQDLVTVKMEMELMKQKAIEVDEVIDDVIAEPYSSSGKWYYNCVELPKEGVYGKYDLLGDQVVTGDIVMDENGLFGLTGHTALVAGHYYSNIFQTYYVRVVEAISDGVCYGILSDDRVDERDSYVYRVNTSSANRLAALNFAKSQIGKGYFIEGHFREDIDADRTHWYCSLLCFASYYHQGVDLGEKGGWGILYPRQLIESSKLSKTNIGH